MAEIITKALEDDRIDLHTCLPGKVQKVYPAVAGVRDLAVDVVLEVKRTVPKNEKEYTTEDLPVLKNVPVSLTGSSEFFLAFALSEGDQGLVVFSEQSIDQWRTKGTNTSPGDIGRHTMSGGVFWPGGVRSIAKTLTDVLTSGALFGKKGGCQLRAKDATMEVTSGGAAAAIGGFVALAALVDAELAKIQAALTGHVHGGVTIGTGSTANAGPIYTPAPVASTNLKAD
jgi:hypothetical protein